VFTLLFGTGVQISLRSASQDVHNRERTVQPTAGNVHLIHNRFIVLFSVPGSEPRGGSGDHRGSHRASLAPWARQRGALAARGPCGSEWGSPRPARDQRWSGGISPGQGQKIT